MAEGDAACASTAAGEPSPGTSSRETEDAPPAPARGSAVAEEAPADAPAPPKPEQVPRPSYAPALANALMGGSSLIAVFMASYSAL
jgi:hypothetical protein